MDISLLKEGLFVMIIGMGTVFVFLTVMIWVMKLNSIFMQKVVNKFFPEELPVEKKSTIPSWEGIDVFRGDIFIRKNTLRHDDPDFWYIVGVYIKRGYLPSNPRNTDLSSPYYKYSKKK